MNFILVEIFMSVICLFSLVYLSLGFLSQRSFLSIMFGNSVVCLFFVYDYLTFIYLNIYIFNFSLLINNLNILFKLIIFIFLINYFFIIKNFFLYEKMYIKEFILIV